MRPKHFLFVDFETFYSKEYSLRHMSVPEYILDPRFEAIMMAAFDTKWPAPRLILPEKIPEFLEQYPAAETVCCSHNALFDLSILSWHYGWVPGLLQDTLGMVRALRKYRRSSLGAVTKELFGRDNKGTTLLQVKGLDRAGIMAAGLWPEFVTYCLNDVRECCFIYRKLFPEFPVEERLVMDLVLRTAVVPTLHANIPMLQHHLDDLRRRKAMLLREAGYDKAALMSTQMFKAALEALGVDVVTKTSAKGRTVPAFAKSDPFMAELLEYSASSNADTNYAVQTLAAARLSEKSTIEETRAQRFLDIAQLPWSNGAPMMPVPLRYGGAHTHRLSGEWSMNMQNLPRDKVRSKLRTALCAPPGHKLITGDLAQIEARIVAKICGQDSLVEAFGNGDDVYANFASVVFGHDINKKDHPNERFIGKTAILGLGYGCGHDRFYRMVATQARQYGIPLEGLFDEVVAEATVSIYRQLFPHIPAAWRALDAWLASVINSPKQQEPAEWGPVKFISAGVILPNGMTLRYEPNDKDLYGAKLLENIVQALARVVVMQSAVRLSKRGLRFIAQSHDELMFAVPTAEVDAAKVVILEELVREPSWMPGLPLAAELGVGDNYGEAK